MTPALFIVAIIALLFILALQLIRINIYMLRIRKTNELNSVQIKEETDWEFIKGLY